jgi:hypothetical protein
MGQPRERSAAERHFLTKHARGKTVARKFASCDGRGGPPTADSKSNMVFLMEGCTASHSLKKHHGLLRMEISRSL